jgi:NADP-dependent 3-hydroxy acid dehydrogenase YdfG
MTAEPKIAIVTGGSQGIGQALVETCEVLDRLHRAIFFQGNRLEM